MLLFFLPVVALASQPTKRAKDYDRGGALYRQNCWMCHGELGEGDGPASDATAAENSSISGERTPQEVTEAVRVLMDGRHAMPALAEVFPREDAERIVKWLENPKPIQKPSKSKKDGKNEPRKGRANTKTPKKAPSR